MPKIYLSPSLQEWNQYITGGTEEQYMNMIADAMVPYLRSNGIQYVRNNPSQTLAQAIAQSNAGNYDLHLAIHSNAAPEALAGKLRGTDVYYYANSAKSKRAADIIAANYKNIYPDPSLVKTVATTSLAELRRTKAPAVLIETAYHDNLQDAQWINDNIETIAQNLVYSLTQYFGIPYVQPMPQRPGTVVTSQTALNIRSKPNIYSSVVTKAPKGASVTVLGELPGWYVVEYNGNVGYAKSEFIRV